MTDYAVRYKDEDGCLHDVEITSTDIPKAINVTFELNKDCCQVIRVHQKPMFED
jgi:translation initiation factor 2 alpha subunit (eIF-2alpha)